MGDLESNTYIQLFPYIRVLHISRSIICESCEADCNDRAKIFKKNQKFINFNENAINEICGSKTSSFTLDIEKHIHM